MFRELDFRPLIGLSSPHLQMIFANYSPAGDEPPTKQLVVRLSDGDKLCCEVSTPPQWRPNHVTLVLLHGLGGSHTSPYMIRLARKFFHLGKRVVRINMRGAGSGKGLNKKSYMSGNSQDVLTVLQGLRKGAPFSPIHLVGFSLGGNIILKMAGELGKSASRFIDRMMAICPALDLWESVTIISKPANLLYQKYYLASILEQAADQCVGHTIGTMTDFDEKVTAPLWGYASASDYYKQCSSLQFIPEVSVPCDLLFAADDPFIDYTTLNKVTLSKTTRAWLTTYGSHMGFIGKDSRNRGIYWMDQMILDWHKNPDLIDALQVDRLRQMRRDVAHNRSA